ncbi:phage protein NinX family protein [Serratia sp. J2]|uniref:phage protein NinX family protein n=1 Tax=Serratia sp. J2 TaxID=3386551 RepID=UPI0039173620
MNYSELSDFEINQRVAKLTGNYGSCEPAFNAVYRSSGTQYDPCNRPDQAWPIIVGSKISVIWAKHSMPHKWEAVAPDHIHIDADSSNPLRAAMNVYLMMQEQKA